MRRRADFIEAHGIVPGEWDYLPVGFGLPWPPEFNRRRRLVKKSMLAETIGRYELLGRLATAGMSTLVEELTDTATPLSRPRRP